MFSVLKITEADRRTLPERLQGQPVFAVYEQGRMTGYCAFTMFEDHVRIDALAGEDPFLTDTAFRTVLVNAAELVDRFAFDADFTAWDRLLTPRDRLESGEFAAVLHSCGG